MYWARPANKIVILTGVGGISSQQSISPRSATWRIPMFGASSRRRHPDSRKHSEYPRAGHRGRRRTSHVHSEYALLANVIVAAEAPPSTTSLTLRAALYRVTDIYCLELSCWRRTRRGLLAEPQPLTARTAQEWESLRDCAEWKGPASRPELAALYLKAQR